MNTLKLIWVVVLLNVPGVVVAGRACYGKFDGIYR